MAKLETVRTNLCTNPRGEVATTGWLYQNGTGEASALTRVNGAGPDGAGWFVRATVTTPKTTGNSGLYRNDTGASGVAGDKVTGSVWVRSSKAVDIRLTVSCRVGTGSSVVGSTQSDYYSLEANKWTRLSATAVASGDYGNVQVWAILSSGNVIPAGGTLDTTQMLIEKSGELGEFFDGSTPAVERSSYAWLGAVGLSASVAQLPALKVVAEALAEGPWAGVTVRGLDAGVAVLNLWRTADGERLAVRGGRGVEAIDSAYVIDYEVPLGRLVSYELEVVSGADAGAMTAPASVTVASECGYIHDPLDPTVVVPVYRTRAPGGAAVLGVRAWESLKRSADVELHQVIGSKRPVAIGGQRQVPADFPLDLLTDAEAHNTVLRNLMAEAAVIVVRGLPGWLGDAWPGVAYVAVPEVVEVPLTAGRGGAGRFLTQWTLQGQAVRASSARVLVALFTYQDVEELFATYNQKQAVAGGGSYLDDLKKPLG
ncbi:minor tail protein [Arthrobacter phage Basilisk]|nr:minor tail protein [Arthrobacter phage Basilisk]